jgi:selenide, water dikinase
VLRYLPKTKSDRVLVGPETSDDAGVYLMDDGRALIQTLDFFTPIVDDPFDYGQIAAANSLSDVYAMGGTPITALNILGYPVGQLPEETLRQILQGGAEKVAESGAVLLGGHSVDDPELKYGLSVTGIADPRDITANKGARPGDDLVLTKALGTGILTQALKRGEVDAGALAVAVDSMKRLNAAATRAMVRVGPHAATDVTGFGLLGHLFEILAASGVGAEIDVHAIPLLPLAEEYAVQGISTGGARKNRQYLEPNLRLHPAVPAGRLGVLFDPQTSGGLLIAVAPEKTSRLLAELEAEGVPVRAVIGKITDAPGKIQVEA